MKFFSQKQTCIIFLATCCLLIVGCSVLQNIVDNIQKPEVSVTDMRVTDFDFDEIELTYDVTIDNPNSLSVQMSSYDYDFKLNNETFIEGQQNRSMEIKASGKSIVEVPLRLNFKKVYAGIQTLANADEASYEFLSVISFDLPVLGFTEVPVNKKGTLPMINTPRISIKNLQVQNLSLTKAGLVLNLEFANPNAFDININSFDYNLSINGDHWAQGNAFGNTSIAGKGTSELQIPITLNISEMGLSVYRILTESQDLDYQLNGNFNLDTTHPLLDQTNFSLNRNGMIPLSDYN